MTWLLYCLLETELSTASKDSLQREVRPNWDGDNSLYVYLLKQIPSRNQPSIAGILSSETDQNNSCQFREVKGLWVHICPYPSAFNNCYLWELHTVNRSAISLVRFTCKACKKKQLLNTQIVLAPSLLDWFWCLFGFFGLFCCCCGGGFFAGQVGGELFGFFFKEFDIENHPKDEIICKTFC